MGGSGPPLQSLPLKTKQKNSGLRPASAHGSTQVQRRLRLCSRETVARSQGSRVQITAETSPRDPPQKLPAGEGPSRPALEGSRFPNVWGLLEIVAWFTFLGRVGWERPDTGSSHSGGPALGTAQGPALHPAGARGGPEVSACVLCPLEFAGWKAVSPALGWDEGQKWA